MNESPLALRYLIFFIAVNTLPFNDVAHAAEMPGGYDHSRPNTPINQNTSLVRLKSFESSAYTIANLPPLPSSALNQQPLVSTNPVQLDAPLNIGISRQIASPSILLSQLQWKETGNNVRIALLKLRSAEAKALRLHLFLAHSAQSPPQSDQISLRFKGSDEQDFEDNGKTFAQSNGGWSAVISGDVMTIEIAIQPTLHPEQWRLYFPELSHLFISPADSDEEIQRILPKDFNLSCEQDVSCFTEQSTAFNNIRTSVARMIFTEKGNSYLCTGTLLDNENTPKRALFWTAAHCIHSKEVARNLITYWFYEADACQSRTINTHFVALDGGARLLYTNQKRDTSLLELKKNPPQNAFFAGWTSDAILMENTSVLGIHHPKGTLKKYAQGYLTRLLTQVNDKQWFYGVIWDKGQIDFGSSGSGLFTLDQKGHYLLRGGLYAAKFPQCTLSAESEVFYSRFSDVFPVIKKFLLPSLSPRYAPSTTAPSAASKQR